MTVEELCKALNAEYSVKGDITREITGAVAGDLLSFIMGNAEEGSAWVTIQMHLNVAAVAVLKDIPLIITASGREPAEDLAERCKEEGISVISLPQSLFEICGKLSALGLKG